MTTIVTTHIDEQGNPVQNKFELESKDFAIILHQQNLKVDVLEFVEVNPQDTIQCIDRMKQNEWEWVSSGKLFKTLWNEAFDPSDRIKPPALIAVLNLGDLGLRHIAGMITLGCEAAFAGRSVFFRNPETYLHPKTERYIATMLHTMLERCSGKGGRIQVKGYTRKDGTTVESYERTVTAKTETDPKTDKEQTLHWCHCLGEDKEIVDLKEKGRVTAGWMSREVENDTEIGIWFVAEFVKLRDGT